MTNFKNQQDLAGGVLVNVYQPVLRGGRWGRKNLICSVHRFP